MAETLVLKELTTIPKRSGDGEFYKAIFKGGRKALFFAANLKPVLEPHVNQPLEYELKPGKEAAHDPSIIKVLQGATVIWEPPKGGGGGGGSRPLMTDPQVKMLADSFNNIAAAVNNFVEIFKTRIPVPAGKKDPRGTEASPASSPPAAAEKPTGGGVTPPPAPGPGSNDTDNRERLLSELANAAHAAFPNSQKVWEQWLKTELARRKKGGTQDLTLAEMVELVGQVKEIGAHRNAQAAAS